MAPIVARHRRGLICHGWRRPMKPYHRRIFKGHCMRLSEYTDYTLRVLMYCAAHPQALVTIGELAEHHRLSKNHLMKVVNDLARQGLLETWCGPRKPTSAWSSVSTPRPTPAP